MGARSEEHLEAGAEFLGEAAPGSAGFPAPGIDLLGAGEVALEHRLEAASRRPAEQHEIELAVDQEGERVDIVGTDRGPEAVDHRRLRVHHGAGPLEETDARAEI